MQTRTVSIDMISATDTKGKQNRFRQSNTKNVKAENSVAEPNKSYTLEEDAIIILTEKQLRETYEKIKLKEILKTISVKLGRRIEAIRTRKVKLKSIPASQINVILKYYDKYSDIANQRKAVYNNDTKILEIRMLNDDTIFQEELDFISEIQKENNDDFDSIVTTPNTQNNLNAKENPSLRIELTQPLVQDDKDTNIVHQQVNSPINSKIKGVEFKNLDPCKETSEKNDSDKMKENVSIEELVDDNGISAQYKEDSNSIFKSPVKKGRKQKPKKNATEKRLQKKSKITSTKRLDKEDIDKRPDLSDIDNAIQNEIGANIKKLSSTEIKDQLVDSNDLSSTMINNHKTIEQPETNYIKDDLLIKRFDSPVIDNIDRTTTLKRFYKAKDEKNLRKQVAMSILSEKLSLLSEIVLKENIYRIKREQLEIDIINFANQIDGFKSHNEQNDSVSNTDIVAIIKDFINKQYME